MTDLNLGPLYLEAPIMSLFCVGLFILAYGLVIFEEVLKMPKSKPMILAGGLIWGLVGIIGQQSNQSAFVASAIEHHLLEYGELLLFLLVAMCYVNAMEERQIFSALRQYLTQKKMSYRSLFWITGFLAFFISPLADNLTTALILCSVVIAVGSKSPLFINLSCINIVVAANAGGAFSPFGDLTTLMVWQKGILPFFDFFALFLPSLINFMIPAFLMNLKVPKGTPEPATLPVSIRKGGFGVVTLFLLTIMTSVGFQHFLGLPAVLGMMLGFGYLQAFTYYLKECFGSNASFDVFKKIQNIEWDTLLFFYGVILCVGGLATLGYLAHLNQILYQQMGPSTANILVGFISAIVDNIPVMVAILNMLPTMNEGQWLLVTLTAGVGGSLLSIGSAAGVALMGQARGYYTFLSHLRWSWAIFLGYIASIAAHFWLNHELFV